MGKIKFIADSQCGIEIQSLRFIKKEDSNVSAYPERHSLIVAYEGQEHHYFYGRGESAKKLRDEMFDRVTEAMNKYNKPD